MEPQLQGFQNPEKSIDQLAPHSPENYGVAGGIENRIEQPRDGAREAKEVLSEGPKGAPAAQPPHPPPVLDTSLVTQSNSDGQQSSGASSSPLVAADVDLIEKEWVDRAKLIVSKTRDDPHEQENEISKLQAEYIKMRYGREIKTANGG